MISKKNIFYYSASAILLAVYVIILLISLKPDVSWEYRLHYIDAITKKWPGNGGYSYTVGTEIKPDKTCTDEFLRFDKGWSHTEEDGTWTDGDTAYIYFSDIPDSNLFLDMKLLKKNHCRSVEIYANDILISSSSSEEIKENGSITADIKKGTAKNGHIILRFEIKDPESTDKDKRLLGIKCRSIAIYEKN